MLVSMLVVAPCNSNRADMNGAKNILNNVGPRQLPWITPVEIFKGSDKVLWDCSGGEFF